MPYADPAKRKAYQEKYRMNNRDNRKEYNEKYYEENKEEIKEQKKGYRENKKERAIELSAKHREDLKQHAYNSITTGKIINQRKWDIWCGQIKRKAPKHPYSDDFANDIIFNMMIQGCFYCGDIATSIDRIDSRLSHTLDNCTGCCKGCNKSKGAADSSTFIRKAFYRAREDYYDADADIWFVNKTKPRMTQYKYVAARKGVPFDITREYFDILIKGECVYCKRRPTTWFGIDRVVPSQGYVIGNVVSCCYDCNLDKLDDDADTASARNERIAVRMVSGELVIDDCEKVILHQGTRP